MTYSEQLKSPKWQKKRLEIMGRDKFTCQICGDKETQLNVHHKEYSGNAWEANNKDLTTICKHCHKLIHFISDDINKYKVRKKLIKDIRMVIFLLLKDDLFVSYVIDEDSGVIGDNGVIPKPVLDMAIDFYTGI